MTRAPHWPWAHGMRAITAEKAEWNPMDRNPKQYSTLGEPLASWNRYGEECNVSMCSQKAVLGMPFWLDWICQAQILKERRELSVKRVGFGRAASCMNSSSTT